MDAGGGGGGGELLCMCGEGLGEKLIGLGEASPAPRLIPANVSRKHLLLIPSQALSLFSTALAVISQVIRRRKEESAAHLSLHYNWSNY